MVNQVKSWIGDNIKWIITLVVIGVGNFYFLAKEIQATSKDLESTKERVENIETWKEELNKTQIIKDELYKKQIYEIQLNLKSLMEKNGLKYLSITE